MIPWIWVAEPQAFAEIRQSSFSHDLWNLYAYGGAALVIAWQLLFPEKEA